MIAVDASVLVAIAVREEGSEALLEALTAEDAVIGAPTLLEAFMVLHHRDVPDSDARAFIHWVKDLPNVRIASFDEAHLGWAQIAVEKFGKGGGSGAGLNILDCASYAVARAADAPLLFTGGDFRKTDVAVHGASRVR